MRKQRLVGSGWSLVTALGLVNAACNGPPPPAPVLTAADSASPLVQLWTTHTTRSPSEPMALDDSTAYVGGADRRVVAVNLKDGRVRWVARVGGPIVAGLLRVDSLLFVPTDQPGKGVYAVRTFDGRTVWSTSTGGVGAPLSLINGLVVASSRRGEVLALAPTDGAIRWRRRMGAARAGAVAGTDSTIIVATLDSIFQLRSRDGEILQRVPSPGVVFSGWIQDDNSLIAGTGDSAVFAVRPNDLRTLWSAKADAPILTRPVLVHDTIFALTRAGGLYRAVPDSEATALTRVAELSWPVTASPVQFGDVLLAGGSDGTLRALNTNGDEVWRIRIGRPADLAPIVLNDGLLALGGRGDLHRYRQ